ncbi:MAG: bifunctional UDP-3-O-[3-hydroxymyristoyl] N-acetylglucosamine deacetylase/3-hydroxyacyl-ACP dehydratase [Saprospiraceae bacterium]|nr:bifunctional UDP-3-O-[3-hydroxymyristoyl] N-acetylglucosamine deacetylase/3-hydroxyacyl-ACP dehydratase [Saprospiraceae bacterium]
MSRKTIKNNTKITGKGLHSGVDVTLHLIAAAENQGIRFIRTDLPDNPAVLADTGNVSNTVRSTTIKSGLAEVSTIEHLMAALYCAGITDLNIELNGPEIPILDGSSLLFLQAIQNAGVSELPGTKDCFVVEENLTYKDETTGSEYFAFPASDFKATVIIEFPEDSLGEQSATFSNLNEFEKEIAPCRTFVMLSELEKLADAGLIKGGDLDNAIVIKDKELSDAELDNLRIKLGKPGVEITQDGFLNNIKPYFKNEPARHKLLDLIGDLALLGKDIQGHIVARKPGHKSNTEFTRILKAKFIEQRKLKGKPKYDPNSEPVMDLEMVKTYLPHRYPFLFVDKVTEISDTHIVGIKNVTFNENFFQGHFPGNPVFPGVLQMEALAQTGGILALSTVGDRGCWDTYFLKMENVKFKAKVVPGDTLILKMELLEPIRRGIVRMMGTAYVGNKLVSEGELTAQIIKRKE